jgi:hypothetical protein
LKILKTIPLFLLLLVAFFCLHGSVENYSYLDLREVLWVGIIITCYVIGLFFILVVFTRDKMFAALLAFFIACWYLFFGAIHDWVKSIHWLSFIHSYSMFIPLLIICNIAYIYLLKRKPAFRPKLFLYLNVLLLLYCAWDGFLLANKISNDQAVVTAVAPGFDNSKVKAKPNVYLLVLDGYAGYQSLQDSFGFKNDSFYNFLAQRSFNVIPSSANYDFTFYSMASTLNMQYIPGDFEGKIAYQNDIQQRFNEVRNATVFNTFSSMGYDIENYSFFDVNKKQGIYDHGNSFFPMHTFLLLNKVFHKRLLSDLGWMIYNGKFKIDWLAKEKIYRSDKYNNSALKMLYRSISTKKEQPKFCYTHLLLPHEPYYKDSTGKYIELKQESMFDKSMYVSYLKYTNNVMRSALDSIIAKDSSAVVVIMSDHGFNTQRVRYYAPYTYNNLCAIRFPGIQQDAALKKISNVNLFRYVFNAQFDQKIPYLADSTVWVKHFY